MSALEQTDWSTIPGPKLPPLLQLTAIWTRPAGSMLRLRRFAPRARLALPFQPPIVVLMDPGEIRELLTADPAAVHPGEGSRILEPMLGRNSVILLDEDLHLEQRRLLLPAFHGERMLRLSGLMAELTDAELATWPVGRPLALHAHLQRLTLEIILRAVFGLERGRRLDDLRAALTDLLAFTESPLSIVPAAHRYVPWLPKLRRYRRCKARSDELILAQVRGAPRGAARRRAGRRRHPVDAAHRPPRGRVGDERRRAARRAVDRAGRRPRDDGVGARVGVRAPGGGGARRRIPDRRARCRRGR